MTAIANAIWKGGAIQVSDMRATISRPAFRIGEEITNKSVLYMSSNFVISIGFSGCSYLAKKPTDFWIVELLTGTRVDQEIMFASGLPSKLLNFQQVIDLMTKELNLLVQSECCKALELYLLGFQKTKQRDPVKRHLFLITLCAGKSPQLKRLGVRHDLLTTFLGGSARNKKEIYLKRLTASPLIVNQEFPKDLEARMVHGIRDIAQVDPTVGPDLISIHFQPYVRPVATVRFLPFRLPGITGLQPWMIASSKEDISIMGATAHFGQAGPFNFADDYGDLVEVKFPHFSNDVPFGFMGARPRSAYRSSIFRGSEN